MRPPESGQALVEFALVNGQMADAAALQALPAVVSVRREDEGYSLAVSAPHVSIPALLQQLRQRILTSGLTPDQVRARLKAEGYPETLLDA